MKKIRDEHDIVVASQIDLERAPLDRAESIRQPCGLRVLTSHFQHRRPIDCHDLRARILLRDGNSIDPVSSGDIENSRRPPGIERK